MRNEITIAHISPRAYSESSSFIQANIRGLKGKVKCFYGGYVPTHMDGGLLVGLNIFEKLEFLLFKRISGFKLQEYLFYRELKKQSVDLVFAEYGPTANAIYPVMKRLKIPLVVHFHGFDVYHSSTLKNHGVHYPQLFSIVSFVIAVSKEMQSDLIDMGMPGDKILYSPCGCQLDVMEPAESQERRGFLAVGTLVNKKSPINLLRAYFEAYQRGSQFQLSIIGDGPLLEECKNFIVQNALEDRVILLGNLPHDEVLSMMKKHAVFVQHSVKSQDGNREGTPVAILEASAMSMPVVSTRHAGIQDVVIHEKTGFLIEEQDFVAMGERMFQLEKDTEMCKRMGLEGFKFITENWTSLHHLKRINQRIQEIF